MSKSRIGVSAAIALFAVAPAVAPAWAQPAGPKITYVPDSQVESMITFGPWNLHEAGEQFLRGGDRDRDDRRRESLDPFKHDASGIVPPSTSTPPYSGTGVPYAGYCVNGTPTIILGK